MKPDDWRRVVGHGGTYATGIQEHLPGGNGELGSYSLRITRSSSAERMDAAAESRWAKTIDEVELIPNSTAASRTISVGRGYAREIITRRGRNGRTWPQARGFRSACTDRIVFDIDNHDEQPGEIDPGTVARLQELPHFSRVDVLRTSPTGTQVVGYLPRSAYWSDIVRSRDWLLHVGHSALLILGWGGKLDTSVWHPQAMMRRPGWRTLHKPGRHCGKGWLVRLHRGDRSRAQRDALQPAATARRSSCPR